MLPFLREGYNKLSPAKWRLIKMADGSVSLEPSIGNGNYACQSHYWIRENRVINAGPMSARAIEAVQWRDQRDRDRYIAQVNTQAEEGMSLWNRIFAQIGRMLGRLKALWPW
jgi:hypothetical protein